MNRPAEYILWGGAVGLEAAGITGFDPAAPLAGCRLCGRLFQTKWHRSLHAQRLLGLSDDPKLLQYVLDLGTRWREVHTKRNHTSEEIESFSKTGWAFTPQAANVLSPFGIIPLGKMHQEIDDAMYEASRAPDLTYLEGGE